VYGIIRRDARVGKCSQNLLRPEPKWHHTLNQPEHASDDEIDKLAEEQTDLINSIHTPGTWKPVPVNRIAAAARGRSEGKAPKDKVGREIQTATKLANKNGVAVAPKNEAPQLLWNKFDGNVAQINETVAYYDEHDDELVINGSHDAWADMKSYIQDPRRQGFYSSRSPRHIVYHEIGHAHHFRRLSIVERADIMYKPLLPDERAIARKVGIFALMNSSKFVAEVYAGRRAGRKFDKDVMALYEKLKGPG
jgi:hypothetical protein